MEKITESDVCVRYERDNSVNYAVIDTQKDWDCECDYEVKMLMLNMPEHFLHFTMNEINGNRCVYYDISSKQQLSKLFEYGKITMEDVKVLFSNIQEMVRVVDEYMLNLDRVILKPQHIYVSLANKKYSFMYSPVISNTDFYEKMRSLFEYILERFDHSVDKTSIVKFYEIYQQILVRNYTPYNLMDFFNDEDKTHLVEESDAGMDEINHIDKDMHYKDMHYEEKMKKEADVKETQYKSQSSEKQVNKKLLHNESYDYDTKGKVINDVMPEIIENKKPEKNSKMVSVIIKCVAVLLVLNAAASMFLRTYAVVKLDALASIICIVAGLALFCIAERAGRFISELYSEDKVTEDELIPFRLHKTECTSQDMNGQDIIESKNAKEQKNNQKKQNSEAAYDMLTAKVVNNNDEMADKVNHTMLLSDYLKMLKDSKLTLEILNDNRQVAIYVKEADGYNQLQGSIEPCKYPCTIGSLEGSSDIFIDSLVISKMHACLLQEDDKFYIEDMNSTNGTYINEERVVMHNKTRIADGDILRIASYNFKVCIS